MQRKSIDEIFWEASQLEHPSDRKLFLDQHCGGDQSLRFQLERLLKLQSNAAGFLESPPAPWCPSAEKPSEIAGEMIGPYKLLQKIGEGGMGAVWMAEQVRMVRRRVAIKLIKPGMDSKQILARFEAERQALALMNHPNIARVLDAGHLPAPDARPYFVMELVKGTPITTYCDNQKLTLRQRIELMIPVCEAIHHAHRKGIIHRDIKPSNVLVCPFDGRPVPKVIDFGVAKAIGPRLTDRTLYTEFGQVIGTLEYMSPEQAELNNLDIDTRSDIYALGVLLYELLTGSTPFEIGSTSEASLLEKLRTIRDVDPPTPSNHLNTTAELPRLADDRGVEPRRLPGQLRGELDWIVMKCLEKDRNRRYETAHDLAADLRRYLNDEQVSAHPPSLGYRAQKWFRRHRTASLAASVAIVAVVTGSTGLVLGLVDAARADRKARVAAEAAASAAVAERQALLGEAQQRKQAEEVAQFVDSLFRDLDPIAEPDELKYRLVERLDAMSAGLEHTYQGDPLVRARLRRTLAEVYAKIGNPLQAAELLEKALATSREHLGPDHPATLASLRGLAGIYEMAASRGHPDLRNKCLELLQEWHERIVATAGADSNAAWEARTPLAFAYARTGEVQRALALQREVLERLRRIHGPEHRQSIQALRDLATLHGFAGDKAKQMELHEDAYTHALDSLGWDDQLTRFLRSDLGAQCLLQRRYERAIELYEENLLVLTELHGADSLDAQVAKVSLADAYRLAKQYGKAASLYASALERLHQRYPLASETIHRALTGLCSAYASQGDFAKAIETARLRIERLRARKDGDDPAVVQAMHHLASLCNLAGRHTDAVPLLEQVVATRSDRPLDRALPDAQQELAIAYRKSGRLDEAAEQLEAAIRGYEKLWGPENLNAAAAQVNLGDILLMQEKYAAAENTLRSANARWSRLRPDDWSFYHGQSLLGAALAGQKRYAEAEPLLTQGYEGMKQRESQIDSRHRVRLVDALRRVIRLYEDWGQPEQAKAWRSKLPPPMTATIN